MGVRRCIRILRLVVLTLGLYSPAWSKDDPEIQFIENKNQWRKPVLYKASSSVADIYLLPDRIQYLIRKESSDEQKNTKRMLRQVHEGGPHSDRAQWVSSQLFEVTFLNANAHPVIEAQDPSVTLYNYFIGADRSKWGSKAHGFGTVYYRELYRNIDLKIYSDKGHVKQDWIIMPSGDPTEIRLNYDGAESVYLKDGNLIISTRVGEVTELKPYAYQEINGVRMPVACAYRLHRDVLGYSLPDGYDPALPLIIDPILVFSGYSGSTYDNWGNTATYDDRGNLYSGGMITQMDGGERFPATPGAYKRTFVGGQWDIGILKYDSSGGALVYATYVGGNGSESPHSLFVNRAGELLILGATSSTDFPVTNGTTFKGGPGGEPILGTSYNGGTDIYIAKLSGDGSKLINATYIGGSNNDGINWIDGSGRFDNPGPLVKNYGDETRGDIITDDSDFVYFASNSRSSDLAIVNTDPGAQYHGGTHDAIVMKLMPDLSSVVWNRFLGGSGTDVAYSIKLGAQNDVYAAGGTSSTNFFGMNGLHSTAPGNIDGWIAHISPAGDQITNATYLGTSFYDQAYFMDLNNAGEVFVYGQTQGSYPIVGGAYSNPNSGQFLHKLTADLTTTLFSTTVGTGSGTPDISPTAFLVSECGHIYLSGWGGLLNQDYEHDYYVGGSTFNLPVTANAYQGTTSGNDFYFMVLSNDAQKFLYGTFLGGKYSLTHVDGGTSRFDKRGVVYHSVCASCGGYASDFPAVNVPPARQHNLSTNCNNAAFKFDLSLLRAGIQTNSVKLDDPGLNRLVCLRDTLVIQNASIGGQVFQWKLGDGTLITKSDTVPIRHAYKKVGDYTISLKVIDEGTCRNVDSTSVQIHVVAPTGSATGKQTICGGTTATLTAAGGVSYSWTSSDGKFGSSESLISVTPLDSTLYFAKITDSNGCVVRDTLSVGVIPVIPVDLSVKKILDCTSRPKLQVINLTESDDPDIYLDFGDGTTSTSKNEIHVFPKDSTYMVRVVGKKSFCTFDKEITVAIYTIKAPNVITPDDANNLNDTFKIKYGSLTTEEAGIHATLLVYNRWGKTVYQSSDYKGDFSGSELAPGVYYYETVINNERTCKDWLQIIK